MRRRRDFICGNFHFVKNEEYKNTNHNALRFVKKSTTTGIKTVKQLSRGKGVRIGCFLMWSSVSRCRVVRFSMPSSVSRCCRPYLVVVCFYTTASRNRRPHQKQTILTPLLLINSRAKIVVQLAATVGIINATSAIR